MIPHSAAQSMLKDLQSVLEGLPFPDFLTHLSVSFTSALPQGLSSEI